MAVFVTPIRAGIHTDYLLGGALTLKNGRIDKYYFEGGFARAFETSATTDRFVFYYYNKDHLGNNREVVDIKGRIHQVTNYYPFGAPYADENAIKGESLQPYKYNGKELDLMHGLNTYDYGARQYDPILARWDRVDPLAEKYYHISPYAYCAEDPVNKFDPDGKDWIYATYGNEQFVYYDERIHNQSDIAQYYDNSETIKYLGTAGSIYQGTKDGDKLCYSLNSDGSYSDADDNQLQDEVSISNKLHVGSSVIQKNRQLNHNMYGIYLGPNNPKTEERDIYAIPPVDMLDYAAFRHDKGYDSKNTAGISGVFLNSSNYGDDWNLSVRSLNEVLTSDVTSSRWRWALATSSLFGPLAIIKKLVRSIK